MVQRSVRIGAVLLSVGLSQGCIDAPLKPCVEPHGSEAPMPAVAPVGSAALKTCPAPAAASDGLIDDFEDGDSQLTVLAGRDGYWWQHHDPNGSTIAPEKFTPDAGGSEFDARRSLQDR
jgi:hypothetical protein